MTPEPTPTDDPVFALQPSNRVRYTATRLDPTLTDEELAEAVEMFRKALMVAHAHDWTMDVVAEAAHVCAWALADSALIAELRASRAQVERLRGEMTDHVRRDWRAVTADGGITFSQREGDYGEHNYKARENVEAWIARHPDYGGGMHLECWEQRWSSTAAVWAQIPIP